MFSANRLNDLIDLAWKKWALMSSSAKSLSVRGKIDLLLTIFRRDAAFNAKVKDLYDHGLLYRDDRGFMQPCSLLAHEALCAVYSNLCADADSPTALCALSLAPPHAERGFNLERQVFAGIVSSPVAVPMTLARDHTRLQQQYLLFGGASLIQTTKEPDASDVQPMSGMRVLWIPKEPNATFDGIVMPSLEKMNSAEEPIFVFDPSVTQPFDLERRNKAKTLSKLCGKLRSRFGETTTVIPLLIWDGNLADLGTHDATHDSMPEDAMIMDRRGLQQLGVRL